MPCLPQGRDRCRVHCHKQQGKCRERATVQRALNKRVPGWCGAAPKRGDGAALEALAEHIDGLGSVGALSHEVEAAELVAIKAATTQRNEGADGVQVFSGR